MVVKRYATTAALIFSLALITISSGLAQTANTATPAIQPPAKPIAKPFANKLQETEVTKTIDFLRQQFEKVDLNSLPKDKQDAVKAIKARAMQVLRGEKLLIDGFDIEELADELGQPRALYANVSSDYIVKFVKWATTPGDDGSDLVKVDLRKLQDSINIRFLQLNSTGVINPANGIVGAVPPSVFAKLPTK